MSLPILNQIQLKTRLWLWWEVQNCRMILPVLTWDSTKAFQTKICQHHSNCYKACDYADIDLSRTNLWWYYITVLYNSVFVNLYVRIFFIRITRLKTAKYFRLLNSRLETCTLKQWNSFRVQVYFLYFLPLFWNTSWKTSGRTS